ncbi:XdhC family protein [Subtercola endophyticus]|uniref:XdhC family protein n=1 Tax=Subtercola endophyticus TaxID=2895559 RepID=UPI001E5BD440|nr:XdhC/CoxI family protein [Subtercola endophyticus]UFS61016.1 XdhC family protein [Subtercola endophyticus]
MIELAATLLPRLDAGHRLALATVTRINGSAPRTLGTAMAVDDDGAVIGSISGGCVEGAVYEACREVLRTGEASRQEFGYSDDDAFAVGLACGGRIEVVVQRLSPGAGWSASPLRAEFVAAAAGLPAGVALIVGGSAFGVALAAGDDLGPGGLVGAGANALGADSIRRLQGELAARISGGRGGLAVVDCEDGPVEALFVVAASAPRMIIFGAVDFSAALANASALLGYRVTICDARPVFATAERFPAASEVVVEWPSEYLARTEIDSRTVVCVLTHDDKFDIPLLEVALGMPIAYVGAMGSRRTHARRLAALRQTVPAEALERLHSPIGLDIGASTPEETAVSILAEVLAVKNAATGGLLRHASGPIHRTTAAREPLHAESGI